MSLFEFAAILVASPFLLAAVLGWFYINILIAGIAWSYIREAWEDLC